MSYTARCGTVRNRIIELSRCTLCPERQPKKCSTIYARMSSCNSCSHTIHFTNYIVYASVVFCCQLSGPLNCTALHGAVCRVRWASEDLLDLSVLCAAPILTLFEPTSPLRVAAEKHCSDDSLRCVCVFSITTEYTCVAHLTHYAHNVIAHNHKKRYLELFSSNATEMHQYELNSIWYCIQQVHIILFS